MAERYKDNFVEVLKEGDALVVKDLATKRIVEAPLSSGEILNFEPAEPTLKQTDFLVYLASTSVIILCATIIGIWGASYVEFSRLTWTVLLILIPYSSCQIILHELAHYVTFKGMGRTPDKVGFKLNYHVFPAFYVRMNDAHLLTRTDRYVVHTAGIFVNAVVTLCAFFVLGQLSLGNDWLFVFSWYSIAMTFNCIPILNSDGFKAALALTGQREARYFKNNSLLIKVIVVVSYAVAALCIVRILLLGVYAIMGS